MLKKLDILEELAALGLEMQNEIGEELARIEVERIAEEERLAAEAAANRPQNNNNSNNNAGSGNQAGGSGSGNENRPTNVGGFPVIWRSAPSNYSGCFAFIVFTTVRETSPVIASSWAVIRSNWLENGLDMPEFSCGLIVTI